MAVYDICPACGKERKVVRESRRSDTWVMDEHRRWTGSKMERCPGIGRKPGRKNFGSITFRQP
jgi:hypothetical protein